MFIQSKSHLFRSHNLPPTMGIDPCSQKETTLPNTARRYNKKVFITILFTYLKREILNFTYAKNKLTQ